MRNVMSRWFWSESGGLGPTDAFLREADERHQINYKRSSSRVNRSDSQLSRGSTFYSVDGDEAQYDHFFKTTLREQLALKVMKAKLVVGNMCQTGCGLSNCLPMRRQKSRKFVRVPTSQSQAREPSLPTPQDAGSAWQGQTLQQIDDKSATWWSAAQCPSWRVGNAQHLMLRAVGYTTDGIKAPATESLTFGSMYECVSCDAVSSSEKIEDVVGKLVEVRALPKRSEVAWSEDCPLPRVLCINLMLPYSTSSSDPGCSYIAFFHIKPETLEALKADDDCNCLRMFKNFCLHPAGEASVLDHPERSLKLRRDKEPHHRVNDVSGVFKAIAYCENAEELSLNFALKRMVNSYNGKPTVITKSGYVVKARPGVGPPGEWMEIGIDVRGFNLLARRTLCSYRDSHLPLAAIHFGFMIQAVQDEDLPEGLIADMHVFGIDMSNVHMLDG
mmetsp:Transcript_157427/g.279244  ORF Transcript_157427/g.279244 Transcript_157427/m.279244 type:complete len:444 (+) Transcript_157427:58-1389(+)